MQLGPKQTLLTRSALGSCVDFFFIDFNRVISPFRELNSLISRMYSLAVCLGNLGEGAIVSAGYRGARIAFHAKIPKNSLYFPGLTGTSAPNLTATGSHQTALTAIFFFDFRDRRLTSLSGLKDGLA